MAKTQFILFVLAGYFVLNGCNTKDSKKIEKNNFEDTEYYFASSDSAIFNNSFKSKRRMINDSIFYDYSMLCSDDTSDYCALKFKIINGNWFIKNKNVWDLFYSKNKRMFRIKLIESNKTIIPTRAVKISKELLFGFTCKDEDVTFSTDNNEYFFSPNYGVVIVKDVGVFYKRNDFLSK